MQPAVEAEVIAQLRGRVPGGEEEEVGGWVCGPDLEISHLVAAAAVAFVDAGAGGASGRGG